jgi:hypothetical protein
MAEFTHEDPLLAELRRARPRGPDRPPDDPSAVALLERIISVEPAPLLEHEGTATVGHVLRRRRSAAVRPRRVAIGSVAAVAAALSILAGLGAIGAGGHQPEDISALTLQVVAQRTRSALTAAVTQDVEYSVTKATYPQTEALPERTSYEWTNGAQTNIEVVSPSGAPLDDVWFSGSPSDPTGSTEVLYPVHAWWTKTVPILSTQKSDVTGRDIAARLEGWVDAGQLSVVGTPTVAGHKTIEVSGNALTIGQAARTLPASTATTHAFNLTMWLDPSTYLPIRLTTTYTTPTGPGRATATSNVEWLPATTANLAKLQGQIPSGFTHLAGPPSIVTGSLRTTPLSVGA